ncbi:MAG: hypothetical protein LBC70_06670 [Chitinispirillales bacterium]|jgi:hypothetical protein|nr:hypothetical protein [Chitinispirillales bacterium]
MSKKRDEELTWAEIRAMFAVGARRHEEIDLMLKGVARSHAEIALQQKKTDERLDKLCKQVGESIEIEADHLKAY